ncbi:MAG: DUF839 domain-containing protein [Alphaproteobacteria bacterium]|nr:DUF839 domain-containing protein [Alphaproteobacteria bacterium]MCB9691315.1 DUF839 domain-containing protein [Alphaproteobacteria bacterium]
MLAPIALLGCNEPSVAPAPAPVPETTRAPLVEKPPELVFNKLDWDDAWLTNPGPTATDAVLVDGVRHPIGFHELAKAGDLGFGTIHDLSGQPMEERCNEQDFDALFEARGRYWLTSHFECTPGAIYLSEIEKREDGTLEMANTRNVDFSAMGGVYNPCAGQVTPWGTHLASEEYEPDAREEPTSLEEHGWDYLSWTSMKKAAKPGVPLNPYHYGWVPEVAVMTADGDTLAVKHKAMGRFSHEIAYVLPDERTVYLSDDGRGAGFFMFVADQPAQLASGHLYAAQFHQESEQAGGRGTIGWIDLGAASDSEVDAWITGGVTFADLFDRQAPSGTSCPNGYRFVDQDGLQECLSLKAPSERAPDPARMASRLETRRYAGYMGATTEFEKGEGITHDPATGAVYISFANIGGRMQAEEGRLSAMDHVRLPANPCGAVWVGYTDKGQMDAGGAPIASDHVIGRFQSKLAGSPIEEDAHGNTCLPGGPANPDNLTFLPGYDILMVAEDTKRHAVASLWAVETRRSTLRRVMVAPRHAEITGIHWIPDLGGRGYLTVAVQHPWRVESLTGEEAVLPDGVTDEHKKSITGYLGPFPKLTVAP